VRVWLGGPRSAPLIPAGRTLPLFLLEQADQWAKNGALRRSLKASTGCGDGRRVSTILRSQPSKKTLVGAAMGVHPKGKLQSQEP
jgi:hypothetical protein